MTHYFLPALSLFLFLLSCNQPEAEHPSGTPKDSVTIQRKTTEVSALLDSFNATAARADYHAYFNLLAENAVFMGTDATERWTKNEFMVWSKPFFDRGRAWSFTSIDRHIDFDSTGTLAWFDELLSTQMKICRGSGIVIREKSDWKIQQYVLSMTIPNDIVDSVVPLKTQEDLILDSLKAMK
jgi:hypothetical protein